MRSIEILERIKVLRLLTSSAVDSLARTSALLGKVSELSVKEAAYGLDLDFYATEIDEEYFQDQEERFRCECFGEIKTPKGTLVQTSLF